MSIVFASGLNFRLWQSLCNPNLCVLTMMSMELSDKRFQRAEKRNRLGKKDEMEAMEAYVKKMMKQKPLAVEQLYRHALTLTDLPDGSAAPRAAGVALGKKYELAAQLQEKLGKAIDRRNDDLMALSVADLQTVACSICPSIITPFNLASLAGKGSANVSKARMCELLLFLTGMQKSQSFNKAFGTLRDLSQHLTDQHCQRGELATYLTWPLDWSEHGVYRVTPQLSEGQLSVQSVFHKGTVKIALQEHGFRNTQKWEDFKVSDNFSVRDATLQQAGVAKPLYFEEFFRARGPSQALMDGQVTPPPRPAVALALSPAAEASLETPSVGTEGQPSLEEAVQNMLFEHEAQPALIEVPTDVVEEVSDETPPLPPDMQ
eukprot:3555427-Amphidinium_carterae.3